MIDLQALIGATYIRIGDIRYPGTAFPDYAARYCRQIFYNENRTSYPLSLYGSGVSLKQGKRLLTICTFHQTENQIPENFLFRFGDDSGFISSAGYAVINKEIREEFDDISVFKFTHDMPIKNFESYFFPTTDLWNHKAMHYFTLGFPIKIQGFEENKIDPKIIATDATLIAKSNNLDHVYIFQLNRKTRWHPNGMSGAPIFHLGEDSGGFYMGFSGIIIRGGNENSPFVYAISSNIISKYFYAFDKH